MDSFPVGLVAAKQTGSCRGARSATGGVAGLAWRAPRVAAGRPTTFRPTGSLAGSLASKGPRRGRNPPWREGDRDREPRPPRPIRRTGPPDEPPMALVRARAIIAAREGLGRLERATTPGPDPAGDPSASPRGTPTNMTVETSTWATKKGLAQMLKGGVIMDVVTPDQAKIAEDAGAVAVMALERVPADIREAGGVARMSDPSMIEGIMDAVTIPVMAKARIGHFVEPRSSRRSASTTSTSPRS